MRSDRGKQRKSDCYLQPHITVQRIRGRALSPPRPFLATMSRVAADKASLTPWAWRKQHPHTVGGGLGPRNAGGIVRTPHEGLRIRSVPEIEICYCITQSGVVVDGSDPARDLRLHPRAAKRKWSSTMYTIGNNEEFGSRHKYSYIVISSLDDFP